MTVLLVPSDGFEARVCWKRKLSTAGGATRASLNPQSFWMVDKKRLCFLHDSLLTSSVVALVSMSASFRSEEHTSELQSR